MTKCGTEVKLLYFILHNPPSLTEQQNKNVQNLSHTYELRVTSLHFL